ncbi:MAG TPA: hypothetical protein DEA28_00560 [Firmicutes bacterium]|nr:hypothetical protein [Bacillota bacterium]
MKNRIIALLSLCLCFLSLFGCSPNKDATAHPSYKIADDVDNRHLTYSLNKEFKTNYQNNEKLNIDGLTVYFLDTELSRDEYKLTTNQNSPLEYVIDLETSTISTTKKEAKVSFYLFYQTSEYVYVSNAIILNVKNNEAIDTYIYVITISFVVIALGGWSYLRYKKIHKKDNKKVGTSSKDNSSMVTIIEEKTDTKESQEEKNKRLNSEKDKELEDKLKELNKNIK